MVPAHGYYMVWINRHLGATMLSAFPHDPHRHDGAHPRAHGAYWP
jgi:hypothetical protein